jgi:hypothetical protein
LPKFHPRSKDPSSSVAVFGVTGGSLLPESDDVAEEVLVDSRVVEVADEFVASESLEVLPVVDAGSEVDDEVAEVVAELDVAADVALVCCAEVVAFVEVSCTSFEVEVAAGVVTPVDPDGATSAGGESWVPQPTTSVRSEAPTQPTRVAGVLGVKALPKTVRFMLLYAQFVPCDRAVICFLRFAPWPRSRNYRMAGKVRARLLF